MPLQMFLAALIRVGAPDACISRITQLAKRSALVQHEASVYQDISRFSSDYDKTTLPNISQQIIKPQKASPSVPPSPVANSKVEDVAPTQNNTRVTLKSIVDVIQWFRTLNLSKNYDEDIIRNALDAEALYSISAMDTELMAIIWKDLGMIALGDKLKLRKGILQLNTINDKPIIKQDSTWQIGRPKTMLNSRT